MYVVADSVSVVTVDSVVAGVGVDVPHWHARMLLEMDLFNKALFARYVSECFACV